jgi:hypothetical protein
METNWTFRPAGHRIHARKSFRFRRSVFGKRNCKSNGEHYQQNGFVKNTTTVVLNILYGAPVKQDVIIIRYGRIQNVHHYFPPYKAAIDAGVVQ